MNENEKHAAGTLPTLREDLEYIPVCSDPRGLCVSELHKEGAILKEIHARIERQAELFDAMEKMICFLGGAACLGMVYVLARLVWIIG